MPKFSQQQTSQTLFECVKECVSSYVKNTGNYQKSSITKFIKSDGDVIELFNILIHEKGSNSAENILQRFIREAISGHQAESFY